MAETWIIRYAEADPERGQPAGAEYSVASLADARREHPLATVVVRRVHDGRGNHVDHPFRGEQWFERDPGPEKHVVEAGDGALPEIDPAAYPEGATPLDPPPGDDGSAKAPGKRGKG